MGVLSIQQTTGSRRGTYHQTDFNRCDQPSLKMRLFRQIFAVAIGLVATSSVAEPCCDGLPELAAHALPLLHVSDAPKHDEPVTIMLALMSGSCPTLKIAGRDFGCRAMAFFQTEEGRANFVVALDDPTDDSHVITFSGDNGRRIEDNLYELPIDRMLLKSKDRPKVDGLPVPSVELSTGICKQVGSFATGKVSSIACNATDKDGNKYDLQYESDGSPITVRRVSQTRAGRPAISPFD